jgi:hypothetical protein
MAESITDLKNTVNDSAQMISNQLQGVDSNLLGAFIAVIASAFISNALGIIKYWAPASFLLMWILMFHSFIRSYLPWFRKQDRQEPTVKSETAISLLKESFEKLFSEPAMFILTTKFKNSAPIFRAIGIIFFITFISLVAHVKAMIEEGSSISLTIPITTSLFLMFLPVLLHLVLLRLEKIDLEMAHNRIREIGCVPLLMIILLVLFAFFAILVLPMWSLVKLYPIYEYNLSGWSLFIVLILLVVTALTFINYFSASMVKKEMTIALYNLSNILNRINKVPLGQTISQELYNKLESDYVKAKRYEMSADDSLMVNFYSLVPNETYKTYLSDIAQKQSETKNETSE